jgi:Family of unknown function (DUF6084)
MPDLNYRISGVEPAARGLTPLLNFKLQIEAAAADSIQGLLLNAQIQIQSPQRAYTDQEKEKLVELFGTPERWGQTLRNRLWTHAHTNVGAFRGATEALLAVPCTYDLNVASAKYFYALEAGEVSLLFLFSGSIFYLTPEGRLQVEQVSWNKECVYRMPVCLWRDLMSSHYPNSSWLPLRLDVFERLYAFRRLHGLPTWEATVEQLLSPIDEALPATPSPAEVPA